jgi:hypothetical protein
MLNLRSFASTRHRQLFLASRRCGQSSFQSSALSTGSDLRIYGVALREDAQTLLRSGQGCLRATGSSSSRPYSTTSSQSSQPSQSSILASQPQRTDMAIETEVLIVSYHMMSLYLSYLRLTLSIPFADALAIALGRRWTSRTSSGSRATRERYQGPHRGQDVGDSGRVQRKWHHGQLFYFLLFQYKPT